MSKKFFCVLSCISFMLLCLPVFSSAASPDIYSNLPEPVPTDNCKYFVIQIGTATHLYMISAVGPIDVSIGIENNVVKVSVFNQGTSDFYVHSSATRTAYNVTNGALSSRSSVITNGVYKFSNFPVNSNTVKLYSYGCVLESSFNLPSINVAWNESTDPSVYTSKLTEIYNKLNEIDQNTDNVEEILSTIQSELELYNLLFLEYAQQNHTDLDLIYLMISNIYSLLTEEQTTRAPAIPGEDKTQVDEIMSNEAALNKDYSSDLNNQFNVAGNIFESNGAFSFISNLFSDMILSFPALNTLIIFSLALGLCVLILGRRLNA